MEGPVWLVTEWQDDGNFLTWDYKVRAAEIDGKVRLQKGGRDV